MGELVYTGPSGKGPSDLGPYMSCPQYWAFRSWLRIPTPSRPARIRGTLLHAGLAQLYARRMFQEHKQDHRIWLTPEAGVDLRAAQLDEAATCPEDKASPHLGVVHNVLSDYQGRAWEIDRTVKSILGVEERLYDADLDWSQGADLIFEDFAKIVWLGDHKSTYKITASTLDSFANDLQFVGYWYLGLKTWGRRFGGVIVSSVQWTGTSPKVERLSLPRPTEALRMFEFSVRSARARRRADIERNEPWSMERAMNGVKDCYHRYGACEYLTRCLHGPQTDDPLEAEPPEVP